MKNNPKAVCADCHRITGMEKRVEYDESEFHFVLLCMPHYSSFNTFSSTIPDGP